MKKLLSQGAEVNTFDNAGWTPLHEVRPLVSEHVLLRAAITLAMQNNFAAVWLKTCFWSVVWLRFACAHHNSIPRTPLQAANHGHYEVTEVLLLAGAEPNARGMVSLSLVSQ